MNRGDAYHPGEVGGFGIVGCKIVVLIQDMFVGPLAVLRVAVVEQDHASSVVINKPQACRSIEQDCRDFQQTSRR